MSESLSTMEYERLEQKYIDVKSKLKRALQNNEKYTTQIEKLNKKINLLEKENSQLENEIHRYQNSIQESGSEVSSSERHPQEDTNMMDLIHSKNQQISDLLKDIEDVERENMLLREKLAEAKEQLSSATHEISSMTDVLKTKDLLLQEQLDLTKKLQSTAENLQEEMEICKSDKNQIEKNLEMFSSQVNQKVDDWKELLDKKNTEIAHLKREHSKRSLKSSSSSADGHEQLNDTYLSTLKIALCESEGKLTELKAEMEKCTQDLKENIDIVNKLKLEKGNLEKKVKEVRENEKNIKNQLNKYHDRCQNLQKEVEFANKLTKVLENDNAAYLIKQNRETNYHEDSMKTQSIVYCQLPSPIFHKMIRYARYASKLSKDREICMNVNEVCFPTDLHQQQCSCKQSAFINCARCKEVFCFQCFYDNYHTGSCM